MHVSWEESETVPCRLSLKLAMLVRALFKSDSPENFPGVTLAKIVHGRACQTSNLTFSIPIKVGHYPPISILFSIVNSPNFPQIGRFFFNNLLKIHPIREKAPQKAGTYTYRPTMSMWEPPQKIHFKKKEKTLKKRDFFLSKYKSEQNEWYSMHSLEEWKSLQKSEISPKKEQKSLQKGEISL